MTVSPSSGVEPDDGPVAAVDVQGLYQRYGPMVVRRCRQLLEDEQEALDIAQDVFVRLLEGKDRLRADFPSSLLYRMATNLCLNRLRDRRRHGETKDDELLERIADLDDVEGRVTAQDLLDRLFGRHQESTRTMAVLHYVDGMTLEEVAAEVGLSVSGVDNWAHIGGLVTGLTLGALLPPTGVPTLRSLWRRAGPQPGTTVPVFGEGGTTGVRIAGLVALAAAFAGLWLLGAAFWGPIAAQLG